MSDLISTQPFFDLSAGEPAAGDSGVIPADAGRAEEQPVSSRETARARTGGEDWDSFMSRPENRGRLQAMMAERGKKATEAYRRAEALRARLEPLVTALAARCGVETGDGEPDLETLERTVAALGDAVGTADATAEPDEAAAADSAEPKPDAAGTPDSAATAEPDDAEAARVARETFLQRHYLELRREAEALRAVFPDFSLERELCNPAFLRLTSPAGGLSVEDAFFSLHHREVLEQQAEAVARRVRADLAAAIRSGARPRENGQSAAAPVRSAPDLHGMTRAERLQYIRARYPG